MKITFVLPYAGLAGGIRVVAIYAEQLQKRGHEVTVVSTPRRIAPLREKIKSLLKGKGWPNTKPGPSHFDGMNVPHHVLETCRPITDADVPDADVVIATWWETAEWVVQLSPKKGKKVYFIQGHEVFSNLPIDRVKATYVLPLHKITVSQWLVDILKQQYGIKKVTLVPNGIDTELFTAPQRKKQKMPTVGFMYSTSHFKGCDITCRAIEIARQKIPDLKVVAFGAERPSDDLPLPEGTKFWFQPTQDDIPLIYSSCDAWLFGSRAEGFGLPILEAMACRTPVISTPAGAAPELVCRGGGVLLSCVNSEVMAAAICNIVELSDHAWLNKSTTALETANLYSWESATKLFENALLMLIRKYPL